MKVRLKAHDSKADSELTRNIKLTLLSILLIKLVDMQNQRLRRKAEVQRTSRGVLHPNFRKGSAFRALPIP